MSNIDFGDWDPDDAYAEEPADPEQVAKKIHELVAGVNQLAGRSVSTAPWHEMADDERQVGTDIMAQVLDWLRRQGAA